MQREAVFGAPLQTPGTWVITIIMQTRTNTYWALSLCRASCSMLFIHCHWWFSNDFTRWRLSSALVYRRGNWGLGRLSHLPMIAQLSGRAGTWIQICLPQRLKPFTTDQFMILEMSLNFWTSLCNSGTQGDNLSCAFQFLKWETVQLRKSVAHLHCSPFSASRVPAVQMGALLSNRRPVGG